MNPSLGNDRTGNDRTGNDRRNEKNCHPEHSCHGILLYLERNQRPARSAG
jgi:hypothetical protein